MHTTKMLLHYITFIVLLMQSVLSFDTEVVVLRAARGRDAHLPCGQGKVFLDGPDSYVLWLKNDRDFLYRFPNEETEKRTATRDRIFGTSCGSSTCYDDTSLLIKNVSNQDGGLYRCRVHYQASPSVDYAIDVRLVDSPGMPKLYNGDGQEINQGYVGPLSLGSSLTLICEVVNQQPDTMLYWRRNGVVIERAFTTRLGVLRVEVHVNNLTRAELDAHYECLAQNADVSEPLTASVVVKMYLPPLSVEIRLNNNFDFEAGQPRVVDCVVVGCVPPPSITWHLGETMLRPTVHKELHDGNYTVSSLTLAPSLHDNRHELECRAHNSHLATELFQDKVTLNVGYRPICKSNRGDKIGAVLREAETVTCVVDASPEPLQFSWTFADSKTLYTSVTKVAGYRHRYSSTLTWLTREGDIGLLLCRATNSFGEQKKPCSYTISQGGPPATPDCEVLRAFPSAMRVQCKKGWDGGRPQTVHLEILEEDGSTIKNLSDTAGHFYLPNVIMDDRNLTAVLYASNDRGKSEPKTLYLHTLQAMAASEVTEINANPWKRYIEALAGAIVVIIAVAAILLGTKLSIARIKNSAANPDLVPRSDGAFHREPDFVREERLVGSTNITVNQLAACQNQYSSSPLPACRVLVGCGPSSLPDTCPSSQHSYYV